MFINHCGNIKINNNEDKKLSKTNYFNNNNTSSAFEIIDKNDIEKFNKVFKFNCETLKSRPHKEFSSENHASSASQE